MSYLERKTQTHGKTSNMQTECSLTNYYDDLLWDRKFMVKNEDEQTMKLVSTSFSISAMNKLKTNTEPVIVGQHNSSDFFNNVYLIVTEPVIKLCCTNCYVQILSTKTMRTWPICIIADACLIEGCDVDVIFDGTGRNLHLFEGANIQFVNGAERLNKGRIGKSPTGRKSSVSFRRTHGFTSAPPKKAVITTIEPKKRSPTRIAKLF